MNYTHVFTSHGLKTNRNEQKANQLKINSVLATASCQVVPFIPNVVR